MAPSTIPGAGLGVFAGIDFDPGDVVLYGDIAVPIEELAFHSGSEYLEDDVQDFFIWTDYTWDSSIAGGITYDYLGVGEVQGVDIVELASFGLGAMPNCKFDSINIVSDVTLNDVGPLDRASPGNGAFTPYHERVGQASERILAGAEIFEDYGADYFHNRPELKHVPQDSDYKELNQLLNKLGVLREKMLNGNPAIPVSVYQDLYTLIREAWGDSRVLNVLPDGTDWFSNMHNYADFHAFLDDIIRRGAKLIEKEKTIRDVSWLKDHGICMDGIESRESDIPHAGRGAFTTRYFKKGATIAPVPLIHMPDKDILTMYGRKDSDEEDAGKAESKQRDTTKPIGKQLLLNYVFGHENSTMLLSPYGSITSLINHGSGWDTNARMVWAMDWMTHPEWLELSPYELLDEKYMRAGLGWNLIAMRDIAPGEEVLVDYGASWEKAWRAHWKRWYSQAKLPTGTSAPYIPADELNENLEKVLVNAVTKNTDYSYLGHGVTLYCYEPGICDETSSKNYDDPDGYIYQECRPIVTYQNAKGKTMFIAEFIDWMERDGASWERVSLGILFEADPNIFHFEDIPFNSAHRHPWAFRKEMSIPDDLLPEAWLNLP